MTVPFTVRLPDDLHERIRSAASADMRSLNSEILWLLERGLAVRLPAGRGGSGGQAYIGPVITGQLNPGGGQTQDAPDQGADDDRGDA